MPHVVDIYGGQNPSDVPAYTLPFAARHVRIPAATLRYWVVGRDYEHDGKLRHAKPLIVVPDGRPRFLSFRNLVEAHVLASMRRTHEVPMHRVRRALAFLEKELGGAKHPLATESFRTDGVDIFVDRMNQIINASTYGQTEIREALVARLKRVRYEHGFAAQLFPYVRDDEEAEQPKFVVIDPRVAFGRPVLVGSGIPVEEIADRFQAGDSASTLAKEFSVNQEMVEEAVRAARAAA